MTKLRSILIVFLAMTLFFSILSFSVGAKSSVYYEDKVAVLMYHHLDPDFKSSATIRPDLFEAQIKYLVDAGYNFISMSQFESYLYRNEKIPINSVLITFDDSYRSYYEYAYPILQKYEIPSTNFIIGEWVDKESSLSRLTSTDMLELANDSLVDLQSHTFSLHKKNQELKPYLTTVLNVEDKYETQEEYYNRIKSDLEQNKINIETVTGKKVYSFAYPYGAYNSDSISALKETGYTLAFTINKGMVDRYSNPYLLPRINAGNPEITPEKLHETILTLNSQFQYTKSEKRTNNPNVYLNNQLIEFPEQKPFIRNGLTYVPVRVISEELGAKVYWDNKTQKVIIATAKNEVFELENNNKAIKKGDQNIFLEAAPTIYYGNFMVPIRFIETIFGATIEWDGINKTINIYHKGESI